LFLDRGTATAAAEALARTEPGWWSRAGVLLSGPVPLAGLTGGYAADPALPNCGQ
jgi:hypothetical protein